MFVAAKPVHSNMRLETKQGSAAELVKSNSD